MIWMWLRASPNAKRISSVPNIESRSYWEVLRCSKRNLYIIIGWATASCYGATAPATVPTIQAAGEASASPAVAEHIWNGDFSTNDPFAPWKIGRFLFGQSNYAFVDEHEAAPKLRRFLRVQYPKGSWSPANTKRAGVPVGGLGFFANCGIAPREQLHLRYYLRFAANFDFVKGGKLPGLYGGTGNSGGVQPDGSDGFSARLMWRSNGDGEVYAYLPTNDSLWGISLGRGSWRFKAGTWTLVEQQVVLNVPGQANGSIKLWIDEKLVIDQAGLRFRDVPQLKIDGIMFSTFFGGNDASWATPITTHIDFARFALSGKYIGP